MPTVTCEGCGRSFPKDGTRTRFCDHSCYVGWSRKQAAESLVARFWAKVNRAGTAPPARPELGSCWFWTASAIRGYGQFNIGRVGTKQRTVYAHRYAWELTNGPIGSGLSVLHRCDEPLCVRPAHLFLGTQQDNLDDARQKGRLIDGAHRIRVSDEAITDICANYVPRKNGRQLAAKHGICLTTLLRFVNGTARVNHHAAQPTKLNRINRGNVLPDGVSL